MCVALVASLTEEMAARSFAYHAHGTADGGRQILLLSWVVSHDINMKLVKCDVTSAVTRFAEPPTCVFYPTPRAL